MVVPDPLLGRRCGGFLATRMRTAAPSAFTMRIQSHESCCRALLFGVGACVSGRSLSCRWKVYIRTGILEYSEYTYVYRLVS